LPLDGGSDLEVVSTGKDRQKMLDDMKSCPECGGEIGTRPTADGGASEDVCLKCGYVIEAHAMKEVTDKPLFRRPRMQRGPPKASVDLLDEVDPSWRRVVPRFYSAKDPNPALSSLFQNPHIGVWGYKDRTKPSRRSVKTGFDEVYCIDKRRIDKYPLHRHIRMLVRKALTRFAYSSRGNFKRRKGLFAACLYVEAMLQCFRDIKMRTAILGPSRKAKQYARQRLVTPREKKRWASCFHVSEKTIMKRIREIEQETPIIRRTIDFVKNF